jgi:hypothetical protein
VSKAEDRFKSLGGESLDESTAKAIDRLSTPDKIKLLSVLSSRADIARFALMYNVGESLKYKWLVQYADDSLSLMVSHKGRGRSDIVEAIKANVQKAAGALRGAADFIRGR